MISIIVPVYNSGAFLQRCINSIVKQTYTDWELLLVDDGSTDDSWDIIMQNVRYDERIRGIQQSNKGAGIARNTGIDSANGDYIVFVDSDDYIDGDYLELVVSCGNCDLIFIDVLQVNENGKFLKNEKMSDYNGIDRDNLIRSTMTGKIPWGGVRKVYKRDLIYSNAIRYSDSKNGEEAVFSFAALYHAKHIGFIDKKSIYYYVIRENSTSSWALEDPWGPVIGKYKEYLCQQGIYREYASTLNAFIYSSTLVSIDRLTKIYSGKALKNKVHQRLEACHEQLDESVDIDIQNMMFKVRVFVPLMKNKWPLPIIWASKIKNRF